MLPIIACTDGSLHATAIYQNAAWAAARMNAAIRVLHVIERAEMVRCPSIAGTAIPLPNADLFEDLGRMDESHAHIARLRGEEVLATAEKILGEIEHCEVTTLQRHGTLHEVLQELEKDASLIVLGKRGEEADPTCRQLGGNLGHVVRSVHIPVWAAARDFRPIRRFLIAFDGGASSLKAVRHVATQALLRGLDCHLVAVGQPASPLATRLEAAAEKLRRAGFQVTSDLFSGDPATIIAGEARNRQVDLLVIGAYGRSRMHQLILGSTTTALIRNCPLSLLLFR